MDFSSGVVSFVVAGLILGFFFRNQLRARCFRRRKPAAESVTPIEVILPEPLDLRALTSRLYELDKIFGPFGSNAAHPSDLHAQPDFGEAVRLLALPGVPLATVLQYVEATAGRCRAQRWRHSNAVRSATKLSNLH